MSPANASLLIVVIAILFRLVFAGFTGLGIDESYMVAASNHFAASYFDHPLASWWFELASRWVFGGQSPIVVRLPFILLSGVSSWLLYRLTNRLYGAKAAFWAVVAYCIAPVFSLAFGCWVLPDGPLDAALLAMANALCVALGIAEDKAAASRPAWWLLVGLFGGAALLAKYSAALVLAGVVMFVLSDAASRPVLRKFWPWVGGVLALVMLSPVVAWNAAHGWQSFGYQSGRATGGLFNPLAPLKIWGGEAVFILPWLWLPMMWLLIAALRRGPAERRDWLLAMLGVIPVVLFSLVGLWSSTRILYHWATPGYLLLLPMLGAWAAKVAPWWRNSVAGMSAFLLAAAAMVIVAQVNFALLPQFNALFPPGKSPLLQVVDWKSLPPQIATRDVQAVAATRWYDAGKIGYALGGRLPMMVMDPAPHEFGITAPVGNFIGKNILLLAMPGDEDEIAQEFASCFKTLAPAGILELTDHDAVMMVIPVLRGEDLLAIPDYHKGGPHGPPLQSDHPVKQHYRVIHAACGN